MIRSSGLPHRLLPAEGPSVKTKSTAARLWQSAVDWQIDRGLEGQRLAATWPAGPCGEWLWQLEAWGWPAGGGSALAGSDGGEAKSADPFHDDWGAW